MRVFVLSDINSANDQVTVLPFLLEDDAIDYCHSLTKQVQDNWYELMRVLGQRFDCISHEPGYLSRLLTLKENEVPRHADHVPKFRTFVIELKFTVGDPQKGYLVNLQLIESLSNDAARQQYIVGVPSEWRSGTPFGSETLVKTITESCRAAG